MPTSNFTMVKIPQTTSQWTENINKVEAQLKIEKEIEEIEKKCICLDARI